jgi:lyso-ornithine lipid O-acyltransferase
MTTFRAGCRLVVLVLLTLPLLLLQLIIFRLLPNWSGFIPIVFHRLSLKILGVKIRLVGRHLTPGPCLIVANHVSWLDISVLGSLTELSFVAKKEVASWPVFGLFAKLQRCLFVDRDKRTATAEFKENMRQRLDHGDLLVLFPEGTSSDGNRVLPFRSALMSAAEVPVSDLLGGSVRPIKIQPVSIAYTRLHGLPMGRQYRPYFAWYGDMEIAPHIWEVMKLGPCDVTIHVHEAVTVEQIGGRKALAKYCEAKVKRGMLAALLGRPIDEIALGHEKGSGQEILVSTKV